MVLRLLSDNTLRGMLMLTFAFIAISIPFTMLTLFKGNVVFISRSSFVYRRKISDYKTNLDFGYVFACVFTILFGPILFICGIVSLFTLINYI